MKSILLAILLNTGFMAGAQTVNTASSVRSDWTRLAEVIVEFDKNAASMATSPKDKYVTVHFRVNEGQVELRSAVIYYENGEKQAITINQKLKVGESSKVFYLRGGTRIIRKVDFKYRSLPHTDEKRARVEFWASKLKKTTVED